MSGENPIPTSAQSLLSVVVVIGCAAVCPVVSALDLDGSGLSDVFESRVGVVHSATDDPDGDGRSMVDEFRAGTDPLTADPGLDVVLVAVDRPVTGPGFKVAWNGVPGVRYEVRALPEDGDWAHGVVVELIGDGQPILVDADQFGAVGDRWLARVSVLEPLDIDGDGLDSVEEAMLGTSAGDPDSDDDGCADALEWAMGEDPTVSGPTRTMVGGTRGITGLVVTTPGQNCAR